MKRINTILVLVVLAVLTAHSGAATVGDLTTFKGERDNVIEAIGVVVGLDGTGDSAGLVNQALSSLLARRRINIKPTEITARNCAIVSVQARFGPFLREGQRIDVTVASVLDAKSLFGGQLLETHLEGVDGRVYALAAGPVTVGGFVAGGEAAKLRQNHTLVGRIPGGGIVEQELEWKIVSAHHEVSLLLREPSYRNATRIADAINEAFPGVAAATDAGRVRVRLPQEWRKEGKPVAFLARLVGIKVDPAIPSRVVMNERTGTIIAGGEITLGPVSISHGNLIISIAEAPKVSQPQPFSRGGTTKVVPRTKIEAEETASPVVRIPKGTKVADMAAALNAVGISPRDMVVIFQMLKRAGALHAELVVE